jgi:antitoxin HicB
MKEKNFTKAEMARRMHTSRAALDRLLDPDYDAVTLATLSKAAAAVGRELRLELR